MLHNSLSLNSGNDVRHGYSILFNLEKIFEQCIERLLIRSVNLMKMSGLQCKPQASINYAKPISGSNRSFYSKPDNLVYGASGGIALVDAKYKLLSDKEGLGNRKPQNPDAYELIAGMTAHACNVGLLVYPKVYSTISLNDDLLKMWEVNSFGQKLKIGSLALDLIMLKDKPGRDKLSEKIGRALDQLIST
jgi:5-methylcytosine-specific restriction endonuclease McrBC regulatory subunit McrC